MDTITVLGTEIVIPQVWDSDDDVVISILRMSNILSKYKKSLELSSTYLAKDDFDLPLTEEEDNFAAEQIDVRVALRLEMDELRARARKAIIALNDEGKI